MIQMTPSQILGNFSIQIGHILLWVSLHPRMTYCRTRGLSGILINHQQTRNEMFTSSSHIIPMAVGKCKLTFLNILKIFLRILTQFEGS